MSRQEIKDTIARLLLKGMYRRAETLYSNSCASWWARNDYDKLVFEYKNNANINYEKIRAERVENELNIEKLQLKLKKQERDRLENIEKLKKQERDRLENIELERISSLIEAVELNRLRQNDYLNVETYYTKCCKELIPASVYERENLAFIKDWLSKQLPQDKGGKIQLPDNDQNAAIGEVWKNTQVIARAGSGKTSTLVNRAFFLQKHCGVAPKEMLLLAFNRKAAKEIAERLEKLCGHSSTHVMTFHALARAIVHPTQELIYNDSSEENEGLDSVFGDVIKNRLLEDDFMGQVRKLMLAQFKQDWDEVVEGGYGLTPAELYRFQKNLARETLRGEYVKSHGEKVISNFLFEHNIPYNYEKAHYWQGNVYRPDFTLPSNSEKGKGIIIEYFGLADTDPEYDEQMEEKRKYWSSSDKYELVELTPESFAAGTEAFEAVLKSLLVNVGITCNRLSDEEIWLNIKPRALKRFSSAMSGFVGRCRKSWILPYGLGQMTSQHECVLDAEAQFLELAVILYTDYLERLNANNQQDFDGLMQTATIMVESGTTTFERVKESGDLVALRYIFIDEYQDFSELFHRLIEAVRLQNPEIKFFCVGDDWQAINSFAGSDLKFYENFDSYFPQPRQLYISTNYRSVSSVVTVGNALMSGIGKPAVASNKKEGIVRIVNLSNFSPTLIEEEKFKNGILTPIILRLAGKALCEKKSVALLSRTKNLFVPSGGYISIEKYLEIIRKLLPEEDWKKNITISTAHSFKGREGDVVIVMDAFERNYPLIHPNWIFSRILGESLQQIDDENRRLFYVALTRAKESLFIITENGKMSPYLTDIMGHVRIPDIDWDKYPPVTGDSIVLIVRISGKFFSLTDEFKADGFQYRKQNGKHFRVKRFLLEGFAIQNLQNTLWAEKALSIPDSRFDVSVLDGCNKIVESYYVVAGQWNKQFNSALSLEDTASLVVKSGAPIKKKSQEY